MFELLMTFCPVGQPCAVETVANFPQYDVGQYICEMAKPAIERGVRSRAPSSTRITFVCQAAHDSEPVEYQYERPQQPGILEQVAPQLLNQVQGLLR